MDDSDFVCEVIDRYIKVILEDYPNYFWFDLKDKEQMEYNSTAKWAAKELRKRIAAYGDHPMVVAELFAAELNTYACIEYENSRRKTMGFSLAHYALQDLIDHIQYELDERRENEFIEGN